VIGLLVLIGLLTFIAATVYAARCDEQRRERYRHRLDVWQREVLDEYEALKVDVFYRQVWPTMPDLAHFGSDGRVGWVHAASAVRCLADVHRDKGEGDPAMQQRLDRLAVACEALADGCYTDFEPIPHPQGSTGPATHPVSADEKIQVAQALWR